MDLTPSEFAALLVRATPEDYFATAIWESEGLGDLTGREADQ